MCDLSLRDISIVLLPYKSAKEQSYAHLYILVWCRQGSCEQGSWLFDRHKCL